jgi:hypothetical protein
MIYYNDKSGRVGRETNQKAPHREIQAKSVHSKPVQLVFKWYEELANSRKKRTSRQNPKMPKQKHCKASKMQSDQTVASQTQLWLPFDWDAELTDFEWSMPTDEELEEIRDEMMNTSEETENTLEDYSLFNDYYSAKEVEV